MVRHLGRSAALAFAFASLTLAALPGCVERRYTIRTEPPGALAIVNNEEIGHTPVSRNFTYYGARDITLSLDGYQTQRIIQPVRAKWYDNLLTEFFSENLVPWTIRDDREFVYRMTPIGEKPANELISQGEALRSQARFAPAPRRKGILAWLGF